MLKPAAKILVLIVALTVLTGCARFRPGRFEPPRKVRPIERTLLTTGYCKCKKCTGWRRTWYGKPVIASGPHKGQRKRVGITASGTKAKKGTIAADTSRYPFGTIMYVPGYGHGRVEDRGGVIKGDHVDLFFKRHKQALHWGTQHKRVKIWLRSK